LVVLLGTLLLEPPPPIPFCFGCFWERSHVYVQDSLDSSLSIYVSHWAGMTGLSLHAQFLLLEMGGQGGGWVSGTFCRWWP
jgi:hypothetical protein